ncbi:MULTISPECIES: hypothetical protein [Microbacterium]|uniref:hypothetical protein n=1 Tax=Microbacterium TaxID=33882 RepID=UPI002782B064|nr:MULTISPECIES: hypothetical protein [Microbacterium]MDQ1083885.1 hypothetical protein [Microbacterium sp. SORGH_AS_0344]MDQ1170835.1 hypothetical protein [Microbacterium proteolyticum]
MALEPSESVAVFESALRSAIREVLPEWKTKLQSEAVEKLEEKQTTDEKKRDGAVASTDLLDYTETTQLTRLVESNWEKFKPVFQDLARLKVMFALVNDYRNPAQHNRVILPFERDLLSGGAQQVQNQVAIFRGTSGSETRYYPRIESATDQLGRSSVTPADIYSHPERPRLDVGDWVEVRASAVAARGFDLEWWIFSGGLMEGLATKTRLDRDPDATGSEVVLRYQMTAADVGEQRTVHVRMASTSKFHRSDWYDGHAFFHFAVNPPEDE